MHSLNILFSQNEIIVQCLEIVFKTSLNIRSDYKYRHVSQVHTNTHTNICNIYLKLIICKVKMNAVYI